MNTKLKCLLLDDELSGLTYLKMLCEQLPELDVVKAFNDPVRFVKESTRLTFDLAIMDIEMPEMDGLQIANLLNGKPVIFVTAHRKYAVEAFELNAIDYISKPVKIDRLKQAVGKALLHLGKTMATDKKFVHLNTNKGSAVLFFDKIAYVKTSGIDSRDKEVFLFDGEEITLKNITLDRLLSVLPSSDFCRINRQEILSIRAVQVFSFDEIITNLASPEGGNRRLTLSERYRKTFLEKVNI